MVVRSAPRSDSDLFSQFFREFHETLEQASGPQFEKLFREFDAAFKESRTQRVDSTPHLDVLQVFGLGMDELRHSRVLSWFLDADAEHEQGVLFAQALLRLVAGEQAPEILDGEHYIVEREKHSRTDVSIYQRRRFAVFIENKVRASERTDQVKDMINSLVRLADAQRIPVSCRFAVFLTDDGREPTTKPSKDVSGFEPHNLKALSRVEVFDAFYRALEPAHGKPAVDKPALLLPKRNRSATNAMRIKELDTSHRCLLQHLETFRKMTTSYEEIRGYVNGVLQEMARDLNQQSSLLKFDEKFDEKTIPKGYLEASDIQAWKGTNDALVSIGLEGFDQGLGAIVGSSAVDQCRAFVYSRYYWSINNDTAIDQLRRKLRSPQGFVAAKQRG